jgi:serine/threonine protein kinase
MTLADRVKDHDRPLDADKCWNGIKDGVEHLHSLGIIHNDLNPRNVMLDSEDTPVIIDFD